MGQRNGRRVVFIVVFLGIVVIIAAGVSLKDWIRDRLYLLEIEIVYPESGAKGKPVAFTKGKRPAIEILQFFSDYTGLPVLYDPKDMAITTQEIQITSDFDADDDLVKVIMKVNGILLFNDKLPSGREVYKYKLLSQYAPSYDGGGRIHVYSNPPKRFLEQLKAAASRQKIQGASQ